MMIKLINKQKKVALNTGIGFFIALVISAYFIQSTQATVSTIEKTWVADTKGCKIWTYTFDKVTWTWTGKCINGYIDGPGVLQQHMPGMNDSELYRFEGNFVRGIENGMGTYFVGGLKHGYMVEGQFENGEVNGPCKYRWVTGAMFDGTCRNNRMYNGTQINDTGSVSTYVQGEWQSTPSSSNNVQSSGHSFGTIFKALAGAVVSVKTGDSTLLNQAVQEANVNANNPSQINNDVGGVIESAETSNVQASNKLSIGTPVTNCINQVTIPAKYKGDLSGTKGITNNCNFPINVRWCVDGRIMNAAGLYTDSPGTSLCSAHYLAEYSLEPKEIKSLGINGFDTLRAIACKSPYRAFKEKWNGNKFSVACMY